jgi:hypothetical protein
VITAKSIERYPKMIKNWFVYVFAAKEIGNEIRNVDSGYSGWVPLGVNVSPIICVSMTRVVKENILIIKYDTCSCIIGCVYGYII